MCSADSLAAGNPDRGRNLAADHNPDDGPEAVHSPGDLEAGREEVHDIALVCNLDAGPDGLGDNRPAGRLARIPAAAGVMISGIRPDRDPFDHCPFCRRLSGRHAFDHRLLDCPAYPCLLHPFHGAVGSLCDRRVLWMTTDACCHHPFYLRSELRP